MDKKQSLSKPVEVESAVGRYQATVFSDLASELKPAERLMTSLLLFYIAIAVIDMSIRRATFIINKLLFREESGTPLKARTLADRAVSMGKKIQDERRKEAEEIFTSAGIDSARIDVALAAPQSDTPVLPLPCPAPSTEEEIPDWIHALVKNYNDGLDSACKIKDPLLIGGVELDTEHCIYVSLDEVGVRHQTEHRPKKEGGKERKRVENTVIHVHSKLGAYFITSTEMREAFRQLSAYLLVNGFCDGTYRFLFFSDGARNIQHYVEAFFGRVPIVLDWYHLDLRMTQILSMAIKADKTRKHAIHDQLCGMLWAGNFDDAAKYLKSLDSAEIKSHALLEEALKYLARKSAFRACYALRKLLGYQNSSNRVEGANDIIVARRQKNQSMSWSFSGSGALASIVCAQKNGEIEAWLAGSRLSFLRQAVA